LYNRVNGRGSECLSLLAEGIYFSKELTGEWEKVGTGKGRLKKTDLNRRLSTQSEKGKEALYRALTNVTPPRSTHASKRQHIEKRGPAPANCLLYTNSRTNHKIEEEIRGKTGSSTYLGETSRSWVGRIVRLGRAGGTHPKKGREKSRASSPGLFGRISQEETSSGTKREKRRGNETKEPFLNPKKGG